MNCELVAHELDAYLDRELDPDGVTAVRAHLGDCARCRRHVAERETLGRLVRSAAYHPAPDRLRRRLAAHAARSSSKRRYLTWAAAAALVLSVGGAAALWRSAATASDAIAQEAVNGHVRSLMADHLFDVRSTDQHTVKPWFLGKLDFAPPVVDRASAGFPLVGGRLDYLGGRQVAALVYQRQLHTINVFIAPVRDEDAAVPSVRSLRGFHAHHWIHDGMSFWAVSDLNDAELTEFVRGLQAPS